MKIVEVKVSDLIFAEYNPRQLTEQQGQDLKDSVQRFGFVDPIIVNSNPDRKNIIIGGHQRARIAQILDIEKIPVHYINLNTDKEKELNIRLNKNTGEWDLDQLANHFDNEDLLEWGFSEDELQFFNEEPGSIEGLTDEDDVPEVEEATTKPGDLWLLGEHRVLCGDATISTDVEKLMGGEKADMVFTDPPYGYKYESNYQSKHEVLMNDDKMLDFIPTMLSAINENCPVFICGSHQTIAEWIQYVKTAFTMKNLIIWKKNNWSMGDLKGAFAGQHEMIMYSQYGRVEMVGGRDTDVWEFDRAPPENHPTQKPIDLIQFAINKFKSTAVYDCFLGSGSTLIACEKTNRKCYGMELDPHYTDVIVKRWEDFTGNKATLSK